MTLLIMRFIIMVIFSFLIIFKFIPIAVADSSIFITQQGSYLRVDHQAFSPVLMSGDGKVLIGFTGAGLAESDKLSHLTMITTFPSNAALDLDQINYAPLGTNENGSFVVGYFTQGLSTLKKYGLFEWSIDTKVSIIGLHFVPPPIGLPIAEATIDRNGKTILFSCRILNTTAQSCALGFNINHNDLIPKVIENTSGYWQVRPGWPNNEIRSGENTYLKYASNQVAFVEGVIGTGTFNLYTTKRKLVRLQGFPSDFSPVDDKLIMNSVGSYVSLYDTHKAEQLVWNEYGQRIIPKVPSLCRNLRITNLALDGTMFGSARCLDPAYKADFRTGLRITTTRAETIGTWLTRNQIANDLDPSAQVTLMSDDGNTVYGVIDTAKSNVTPKIDIQNNPNQRSLVQPGEVFLASLKH